MNNPDESFKAFYERLLTEAPISSMERIGSWDDTKNMNKWDRPSAGIVKSDKGFQKIKDSWNKTSVDFDIYLLKGGKYSKFVEVGLVPWEFVRDTLGLNIDFNDENVTAIYTNNFAVPRSPFTGWIMAHRLAHALRKTPSGISDSYRQISLAVNDLIKQTAEAVYKFNVEDTRSMGWGSYSETDYQKIRRIEKIKKELTYALGTMKSARTRNVRDVGEFTNELIAQYIITGKITLNKQLPDELVVRKNWGRSSWDSPSKKKMDQEEIEDFENFIENTENTLNYYADELLQNAQGNIYLM